MSGLLILVGAGVLGCAVIVSVGLVRRGAEGHAVRDPHGLGHQLAGLLAGGILAGVAWFAGGDHRELVLALGPLAGSCWLVGLITAERRRGRPPLGTLRVAGLGPRTAGGTVSRYALATMRGTFALTAGLAGLAIVLASDRDARSYAVSCVDGTRSTHGPWPGAPYAVPALVALALGLIVAELAIRDVVRRPPGIGGQEIDGARRLLAARTAVTAALLMALPTLAMLLLAMGGGLHGACPTAGKDAVAVGMLATGAALALAAAGSWVAALITGGRSVVPRVSA